ncbi:MAG: ABC transporter permease [Candidatus Saccharimonas sp.]|nr:ABC transporter permease [Candidatus Saccharimonas sp.]
MANLSSSIRQRYTYPLIILNQLVITDFKLRYKESFLGYVWTLLKPLALFAVMYVVFVHFLRFGADVPHFAVYLLLGTVLWNFFAETTTTGMSAIVSKGDLMRKLFFPRYVVVVAASMSALINLAINLFVIVIFIIINGVELSPRALLIIPVIVELYVLALSAAFFLGALCVKLRDVGYIWELVLQAGFYATPIFYPLSMVIKASPLAAKLMLLNPMAQIIQDARWAVISPSTLTIWNHVDRWYLQAIPLVLVVCLLVLSVVYFKRQSPGFAENI